jgi:hypothetical protein
MSRSDAQRARRERELMEKTEPSADKLIEPAVCKEESKPAYIDIPSIPSAGRPRIGRIVSVWDPVLLVNRLVWCESVTY